MAEITQFQKMNGCSGCKHASDTDPQGKPAASCGKGFWCKHLNKAVDSKDGTSCANWGCQE